MLRSQSAKKLVLVEKVLQATATMQALIRCLQFGSNEILREEQIPREIIELLLMAAGCVMNACQKSVAISTAFRDNEGIMTIMSLMKNEVLFPRRVLPATERSPSASFLSDGTSSSLQFTQGQVSLLVVAPTDPSVRKLSVYLAGTLMNLSNVDARNCTEIVSLDGIETLMNRLQLSNDRYIVYCLECVRTCCRHNPDHCVALAGPCEP